jgi:mono/diheme cytochrome c family protein
VPSLTGVLLMLLLFALPMPQDTAAPPGTNPVKPTAESQAFAKKMYGYDCAVCHGEKGDGKGELAADQKPPLKDWTGEAVLKDISDQQMYDIIVKGKGNMPGEGERLKPDQVWNMVIYTRTLGKKG